jgi:hypothetical protein
MSDQTKDPAGQSVDTGVYRSPQGVFVIEVPITRKLRLSSINSTFSKPEELIELGLVPCAAKRQNKVHFPSVMHGSFAVLDPKNGWMAVTPTTSGAGYSLPEGFSGHTDDAPVATVCTGLHIGYQWKDSTTIERKPVFSSVRVVADTYNALDSIKDGELLIAHPSMTRTVSVASTSHAIRRGKLPIGGVTRAIGRYCEGLPIIVAASTPVKWNLRDALDQAQKRLDIKEQAGGKK